MRSANSRLDAFGMRGIGTHGPRRADWLSELLCPVPDLEMVQAQRTLGAPQNLPLRRRIAILINDHSQLSQGDTSVNAVAQQLITLATDGG